MLSYIYDILYDYSEYQKISIQNLYHNNQVIKEDIWLPIMAYIDEEIQILLLVAKSFHRIIYGIRRLTIKYNRTIAKDLCPSIDTLSYLKCDFWTPGIFKEARVSSTEFIKWSHVKHLSLIGCNTTFDILIEMISHMNSLVYLKLDKVHAHMNPFGKILLPLVSLSKNVDEIEVINHNEMWCQLKNADYIKQQFLPHNRIKFFENLYPYEIKLSQRYSRKNLKKLTLSNTNLHEGYIIILCYLCSTHYPTIEQMHLINNGIKDINYVDMIKAFVQLKSLKYLIINPFTNIDYTLWKRYLPHVIINDL